LEREKAELFE